MAAQLASQTDSTPAQFMDQTPPHWAARGVSYALLAVFAAAIIAAIVIQMPEVVTAQFTLAPARGADPVKASRGGVVSRVFVKEGETVQRGDALLTLRSEAARDRAADWQSVQTQLAGAGESFGNLSLKRTTDRQAEDQELRKLEMQIEHLDDLIGYKRGQLKLQKEMADSYEKLYREGIASQAQHIGKQLEVTDLTAEIEKMIADQKEHRIAIEKLKLESAARQTEFKEVERKFKQEIATQEIRAAALKSSLEGSDGGEVRVTAPCAGTILRLLIKNGGAIASDGETMAEIACAGEPLLAELKAPETGVGKLKLAQDVKLKYDAFPYQRYGVKFGKIIWVSPARIKVDDDSFFQVRVELAEREILDHGQSQPLIPGMRGQADIVIGKRSLISYIFEPIQQLRENFRDAPPQTTAKRSQ
jgi:HlyD family type I secretion membrane fusion protein